MNTKQTQSNPKIYEDEHKYTFTRCTGTEYWSERIDKQLKKMEVTPNMFNDLWSEEEKELELKTKEKQN